MKPLRLSGIAVFVVLIFGMSAFGQDETKETKDPVPSPSAIAAGRRLLEASKATNSFDKIWPTLFETLKRTQPSVPEEAWDSIDKEFRGYFSSDELLNQLAAVYARNFTEAELNQIATFYETPLGKRLVEGMPTVTSECFQIGFKAGKDMMERALKRLKDRGYKITTD